MTRLEKIQLAIEKGFTYDSETGKIYNRFDKEINAKHSCGYISIGLFDDNKKYYHLLGHHFAWYIINNEIVNCLDHINQNRSDNRICNLRSISKQQNHFNTKAKGYCWNKQKNKFQARIKLNNKSIHLGLFNNEIDAIQAYLEAKKIYHII